MIDSKEKKIEIMAVGSELLTPYFQDTNSLYLTQRLNDLGMKVNSKSIIGDNWNDLLYSIQKSLPHSDLIFAIGGLGPTQDDLTREAFSWVLKKDLIFKKELYRKIEQRFQKRGLPMPPVNKKQAYIIQGAEVLNNQNGTAPGLWVQSDSKDIVLLPGPPHEFKAMFEQSVWPRLQEYKQGYLRRKILKITGLTESRVESLLSDIHVRTPNLNLSLVAYPGQIEIHLTGFSQKKVEELKDSILNRLQDNVFSTEGEELEEIVGNLLVQKEKSLAVAESCTGGLLAHRITNISGSSRYFMDGVVAYSNEVKKELLGLNPELIDKHGAVSPQVAEAMAKRIREKSEADFALSTTGIAGPTGGTPQKPVGLTYIGLSWKGGTQVTRNYFLGTREIIKFQTTQKALDMLWRYHYHRGNSRGKDTK
ncbi:competence/damage-inducible protein A [bacterium]|nr:competence/damage-inducible protein A [bacterium]